MHSANQHSTASLLHVHTRRFDKMRYAILLNLIVCVVSLPGTKPNGNATGPGTGQGAKIGNGNGNGNGPKVALNAVPPAFNLTEPARALGTWYITYVRNPDTWRVADQFQNWYQKFTYDPVGQVNMGTDIYSYLGECMQVPFNISDSGQPGVFNYIHGQGDVISGHVVLVDTDYTSYLIAWGCTRASLFHANVCEPENYWLKVKTRSASPNATTVAAVKVEPVF